MAHLLVRDSVAKQCANSTDFAKGGNFFCGTIFFRLEDLGVLTERDGCEGK